jgi:N-acetylglucosamine-6-phosphate deacetylase
LCNGRVEACGKNLTKRADTILVEVQGHHVVPGFIDLQVNGGGGRAILEGTEEAVLAVADYLAPLGTTSFLPTIISAPEDALLDTLTAIRSARGSSVPTAVSIAGVHVEGPFLNPEMSGAHLQKHTRPPDPRLFERLAQAWAGPDGRACSPAVLTLAPEIPGALNLLKSVVSRGWRPAFGHTSATYEQAQDAVREGVCLATHAYNRMGTFHHREPGVLGLVLTDPRVTAGFIADGIHVHPTALKAGLQLKGRWGAFLVSDSTPAGDLSLDSCGEKEFLMGDTLIFARRDRLETAEGTLGGALLSPRRALANVIRLCGFSLEEALPWVTETPARVLGLAGKKGILAPAADADVVVLNQDFEVQWVAVGGRIVLDRL